MGFFCGRFDGTTTIAEIFQQNIFSVNLIKNMLAFILSYVPLLGKYEQDPDGFSEEYPRPSSLLVPVPVHCIVESRKEKLVTVEYSRLLGRLGANAGAGTCKESDSECAICLNCIEERHEVRELGNCCHVFHKGCIDVWMDQGQVTCPLCRSKLLPSDQEMKLKCGGDPWRKERMIYLFGEDQFD